MEQFAPVPLSVYNSNTNNPNTVTKQELPKFKPDQNPTYQKITVKKENIHHLIASAIPLPDKILESPRILLSIFNTKFFDGLETGVLLKEFLQHLKREDVAIPDIYFMLIDAVSIGPDLVINSHAKAKERDCILLQI